MTTTFDFASDANLPAALGARMQAVADNRAKLGLISKDGQTHKSLAHKAIYDAGHGVLSRAYRDAGNE